MRAVLQRVTRARVTVSGEEIGAIERGLLVLLGVAPTDTPEEARWLADKVAGVGGAVLVVSQFTLYGDCRKGRRPSFLGAAAPELAVPLYEEFVNAIKA